LRHVLLRWLRELVLARWTQGEASGLSHALNL
jgi:hypothetical protein